MFWLVFALLWKANAEHSISHGNATNILLILADDLGYGDTSVSPFTGSGILTPNLEKMAARGTIMTNFHTAAATCTPTRASILTGMYPWRVGLKAVYEYGEKFKSNRDDWLPLVPTVAMAFRDGNFSTGHSGKWHLGGMRNDDFDMRTTSPSANPPGVKKCKHPGPNQQGFEEYVSVLDGPGAPRQNELQITDTLYSQGCAHLIRNDVPIGREGGSGSELLSDCEARHAIRIMNESVNARKPFYVHLWFHAPHGPWEYIPEFGSMYQGGNSGNQFSKYRTMVSAMDRSVGTVLTAVKDLGIERNTLIVFISDNGPEDNAGGTAGFKGNKRHIYEGGIRVPSIWQWVGTIPKGKAVSSFGVTTDLYPTFLHAANLKAPVTSRLDGISLLPELIPGLRHKKHSRARNQNRVTLWHNEYEGPRRTAAWINDYKIILGEKEEPLEIFDMREDPKERQNLFQPYSKWSSSQLLSYPQRFTKADQSQLCSLSSSTSLLARNTTTPLYLLSKVYAHMVAYAQHGNEAHRIYLAENPGREYNPTPQSDQRSVRGANIYRFTSREQGLKNKHTNLVSTCSSPCECGVPWAHQVSSLPFNKTKSLPSILHPGKQLTIQTYLPPICMSAADEGN